MRPSVRSGAARRQSASLQQECRHRAPTQGVQFAAARAVESQQRACIECERGLRLDRGQARREFVAMQATLCSCGRLPSVTSFEATRPMRSLSQASQKRNEQREARVQPACKKKLQATSAAGQAQCKAAQHRPHTLELFSASSGTIASSCTNLWSDAVLRRQATHKIARG